MARIKREMYFIGDDGKPHKRLARPIYREVTQAEKRARTQRKQYRKRRDQRRRLRKHYREGDVLGFFTIVTVKDRHYYEWGGNFRWRNSAYRKFYRLLKENHENIVCPVIGRYINRGKTWVPTNYEILIQQRVDPECENNETMMRDETGAFVSVKTDRDDRMIILKEPWYIEDTFNVYGVEEKKTAPWIIDEIIMPNLTRFTPKRIFVWGKKLVVDQFDDFDLIVAKSKKEATHLYNCLYDKLHHIPYLYLTGELTKAGRDNWLNKIKEKTGWRDEKVRYDA
jgi:hypothetical protein